MSGWLHVPAALPGGRSHSVNLLGNWVGPRAHFDVFGKEKNLLLLLEIEQRFLGRPARSFVAIPIKLFALPVQAEDETNNEIDFVSTPQTVRCAPEMCLTDGNHVLACIFTKWMGKHLGNSYVETNKLALRTVSLNRGYVRGVILLSKTISIH
jgi:hypothetical protein